MRTIIFLTVFLSRVYLSSAQNTWVQKADFGGNARNEAVGFAIGTKGYIGTGFDNLVSYRDFWEYDLVAGLWSQKADFGGTERRWATGFSIGTKGYVGTGYDLNYAFQNDFWEYDPASNTWAKKTDFGGFPRAQAVGFSIGNKGYIGTGNDNDSAYSHLSDFWEYDSQNDTWTQKTDIPIGRFSAVGFAIGNKGYVGTGIDISGYVNDFWEYDPITDIWLQKTNFPGGIRCMATGFSIAGEGYIGTGRDVSAKYNDFWRFDPALDTWVQITDFGGTARAEAVGFAIGNKGYIGTGVDVNFRNDFWEFIPDTNTATNIPFIQDGLLVFPNPVSKTFLIPEIDFHRENILISIFDVNGKIFFSTGKEAIAVNIKKEIPLLNLKQGIYFMKITTGGKLYYRKLVLE